MPESLDHVGHAGPMNRPAMEGHLYRCPNAGIVEVRYDGTRPAMEGHLYRCPNGLWVATRSVSSCARNGGASL